MSTRKFHLFAAAAALAVAGGVTPASASLAAPPPSTDGMIPSAGHAAEPSAPPGAPPECRDADCVIALKDGQEIVFDKEVGVESLKATRNGDDVAFTVRTQTAKSTATVNAGSSANFNGVMARPYKTKTGEMMLEISHT